MQNIFSFISNCIKIEVKMRVKNSYCILLLKLGESALDIASAITMEASGNAELPASNHFSCSIILIKKDSIAKIIPY